jgi:hypothetical protein
MEQSRFLAVLGLEEEAGEVIDDGYWLTDDNDDG